TRGVAFAGVRNVQTNSLRQGISQGILEKCWARVVRFAFPPPRSKAERGRCRAAAEGAIGRRHQVPPPVLRTTSPALRAGEERLGASRSRRVWNVQTNSLRQGIS